MPMDRIVPGILLILIVVALAIFIYYQMLDRKQFLAAAHYMNTLEERLGDWLYEALSDQNGPAATDSDHRQQLEACLEKYEDTKAIRSEQKVLLLNEAYGILKRICTAAADDPRTEGWKNRLNVRIEEALDAVNQYNHYVRDYNRKLETRTGAVITDLFHLKHLTVLNDLRL